MSEAPAVSPPGGRTRRAGDRAPVLQRVSQAFADGEAINWGDVEALARTARERALTRELRLLATIATPTPASRPEVRHGWQHLAWLEQLLAALAGAQVVVAVLAGLASLPSAHAGRLLVTGAGAAAALALLVHGTTARARRLSVVIWLAAAITARPLLAEAAMLPSTHWLVPLWQALYVEAFLPVALWRLARECPVVVRFTRFDRLSRGVLAAALAWSLLLAAASPLAVLHDPPSGWLAAWLLPWGARAAGGAFWDVLLVWAGLLAMTVLVRTRDAEPTEAHRTRTWLAIATATALPAVGLSVAGGTWPVLDPPAAGGMPWSHVIAALVLPWGLAGPVLWQDRAPRLHVTRLAWLQRRAADALTVAAVLLPCAAIVRAVAVSGRPLAVIVGDAGVQVCAVGGALAALGAWLCRRWDGDGGAGAHLDAEVALAGLAVALRRARTPTEVAAALASHLRGSWGVNRVALYSPGPRGWEALDQPLATLPFESALAAVLAVPSDGVVFLGRGASLRRLLPAADLAWLDTWGVELCAPLVSTDGPPRAVLLVGTRPDGRPLGASAVAMVTTAASTAAMALEGGAAGGTAPDASERELAYECETCGRLAEQPGTCACGRRLHLAALPACLDGKFRLERRIGRGGMGVVYLAVDQRIGRLVALKTLPQVAAAATSALHAEARAMAALAHPSVAVLYGLETWRDTPVLVVEYFGGGTLAARLAQGPLPVREALRLAVGLAETLADLHRRGWLHRDIKPSNLAFGRDGRLMLLDFGLTHLVAQTHGGRTPSAGRLEVGATPPLAGTPLYLSPEALDGCDASPADDVWALALVLFEMVTGAHPFSGATLDSIRHRLCRPEPVDARDWASEVPESVSLLLQQALHPDARQRLDDAADVARGLRVAAAQL